MSIRLDTPRSAAPWAGISSKRARKGGLVEGPNLLLRSSEFDNASWSKTNLTITANGALSPSGAADADIIVPASSTAFHGMSQAATIVASTPHAFSLFAKAGGGSLIQIAFDNGASAGAFMNVDLSTGAITRGPEGAGSGASPFGTVEDFGNGWFRLTVGATHGSTLGRCLISPLGTAGGAAGINPSVATTTSGTILVWRARLITALA